MLLNESYWGSGHTTSCDCSCWHKCPNLKKTPEFSASVSSCSQWTDINHPSAHPPPLNRALLMICRWCKWPGICKIQCMTLNDCQGRTQLKYKIQGRALWRPLPTYSMSDLRQGSAPHFYRSWACKSLYLIAWKPWKVQTSRLPENRIPDGESGISTWPETSLNLM